MEGDKVAVGDALCEIRTDKSVQEFESTEEGFLGKIIVPAGAKSVQMGQTIAYMVDKMDEAKSIPAEKTSAPATTVSTPSSSAPSTPQATSTATTSSAESSHSALPQHSAPYSPAVLRILLENPWIKVNDIKPTGRGGRLTKTDLVVYMSSNTSSVSTTTTPSTPVVATPTKPAAAVSTPVATPKTPSSTPAIQTASYNDVETSQIRKIIASRLLESKQTIPHSYYTIEARIDKLLAIKNKLASDKGVKASVNDIIIYCASRALQRLPQCNVISRGDGHAQAENIDISFAVATPSGLITPIIPKTNTKSIEQISASVKDLGKRAKENKLKPEEFQGGSFCISNLGMFGIQHFAAVINPPHGIILAVGSSEKKPILPEVDLDADTISESNDINKIEFGTFMTVTAACDGRAIDGALAGQFMQVLKEELEFTSSIVF